MYKAATIHIQCIYIKIYWGAIRKVKRFPGGG